MRLLVILLSVLLASCSTVYIPNTRNTPLFREQGEFQASAYVASGADVQVAYALTNRTAMMGNLTYLSAKNSDPAFTRKNMFAEIGIGTFKRSRFSRFEVFAGGGFGSSTSLGQYYFFFQQLGQKEIVAKGTYSRFFIQPSIGTNHTRRANIAFTPRLSLVKFSKFESSGISVTPNEKAKFFFEPAVTVKLPIAGNLEGVFQIGITVSPGESYFEYESFQSSLGLQLRLGGLRTKVFK